MNPDNELLRKYAEDGSEESFRELVRLHLNVVFQAALRQTNGDNHQAEDITQAVFTDLARKARSLTRHASLIGWLHTSTRFAAIRMLRDDRARQQREESASIMNPVPDAPATAEWEQLRPLIDDAIHKLNDRDREVVLLRFFEHRPYAQIAATLDVSDDAARMRVDRALEKLRLLLAKRGISSSAAALAAIFANQVAGAPPANLAVAVSGAALAAGAAGSAATGALGLANFMTTTKIAIGMAGVAALLGLASIGTGVYEWRRSVRDRAAIESISQHYSADQVRLKAVLRSTEEADQALAGLQAQAVPKSPVKRAGGETEAISADWQRFQTAYPEVRGILREVGKAQIKRNFQIFFDQAKLTAAQIEEFVSRTADLWEQNIAIAPDGSIRPTVSQLPDDQLRAILGENGFQQFQAYNLMRPATNLAGSIATSAGSAGVPVSSAQQMQLAEIIANNSPSFQTGERMDLLTVDWATAAAQAQAILAPSQWRIAQGALLRFQFQIALNQAMRSQAATPPAEPSRK